MPLSTRHLTELLPITVPVDPTRAFWRLWFGPAGAEAKMQVDAFTTLMGSRYPDKATKTPGAAFKTVHAGIYVASINRVFLIQRYGAGTSPSGGKYRLDRVNPDDLEDYSYYEGAANDIWADALCSTGGKVYTVYADYADQTRTLVDQFDVDDSPPVLEATYDLGDYGRSTVIATDGTNLFVGTWDKYILRMPIASLPLGGGDATPSHSYLCTGLGYCHTMRYDSEGGKVFVAMGDQDTIVRVDAANLTNPSYQNFGTDRLISNTMALVPGYVYLPFEASGAGEVVKVSKTDLSDFSILQICRPEMTNCWSCDEEPDGDYIWATFSEGIGVTGPGELVRLKVSDDSTQRFWLGDGEVQPEQCIPCGTKDKLFVFNYHETTKWVVLTNLITDDPVKTPASGTNYSYWAPIRLFSEVAGDVLSMEAFSDGANSLGTGVGLLGAIANDYAEPTGSPGTTGTQLTVANYGDGATDLEEAPATVFDWVTGTRKTIDGSTVVAGDVGHFLVLQLSVGTTAVGGATAEEELTFVFTSEAERQKAVTLFGDIAFTRYPDAVAAPAVVPAPTLTFGAITLTPSAVAAPAGIPDPALSFGAISLLPGATAAPASVPDPTLSLPLTLLPGAVATPAVVPAPALALPLTLTPSTVAAPAAIPAPALAFGTATLLPGAVAAPAGIPAPSLSFGAISLLPGAIAVPATVPVVTIANTLTLLPGVSAAGTSVPTVTIIQAVGETTLFINPVITTAAVPSCTVVCTLTLTPDAVVGSVAVPSVTVALSPPGLLPTPVIATAVVPDPALVMGAITLTPSSTTVASNVPALTVAATLTLLPDPIAAPVDVPVVTIIQIGGALFILPTPAVATSLVPSPTMTFGAITLTPGVTANASAVPDSIVVVSLTPSPVTALAAVPTPTITMGAVTLTPSSAVAQAVVPIPTIVVPGVHKVSIIGSVDNTLVLVGSDGSVISIIGSV